jgi:hypothetical protein
MDDNLRNCLPRRVSAMVMALTQDRHFMLAAMASAGSRCSDHQGCSLKEACGRIHEAFRPVARP